MSGAGNCYDNAVAESFFGTLKQEYVHQETFEVVDDARDGIRKYIGFYNRQRLHSSIGYATPWEVDSKAA